MITTKQKYYSVEDYKLLAEGDPHQLINGELIALNEPAPAYGHQGIAAEIFYQIMKFLKKNPIGEVRFAPVDIYLDDDNVLQPDIIYISNERKHIIKKDGLHGAPDLIIEILSPSTAHYDTQIKKDIYEKHGVREYWIINPETKEATGFENIGGSFMEFYGGFGKFTLKMLNIEISLT